MRDPYPQSRRVALTRSVSRNAKDRRRKALAFACESATHEFLPLRVGPETLMYRVCTRERVRAYARVRPRMRKGLKTESQSRKLAAGHGSYLAEAADDARGNSRESRQGLLRLSGPVFGEATGRDPLGRGRSGAASGTGVRLGGPLATGGVGARLGANGRGDVVLPLAIAASNERGE